MKKNIYQKHIKISARDQKRIDECKDMIQKFVDAHDLPYYGKITDSDVLRQAIACMWKMLNYGSSYEALWQLAEELEVSEELEE